MNPPNPREESIFHGALELPLEARPGYLKEACGQDEQLLARVRDLLSAHDADEAPLGEKELETIRILEASIQLPGEKLGDRLGPYRILQLIGEGGCGSVYMAEQEEPVARRVALKVIKLGMDTREVLGRFEVESRALALMDHPNIARVLDAGATETGRPFFAMELVRGVKITEYCDQHNLPMEERLKLFVQVCRAIQHAHQKGIIHRDIKPSNILVTVNDGVPVPKIIDFGIAKAIGQRLTDKTIVTRFKQFIGTPPYMSPEQAEMSSLDIDTRSDIYSLGVLLYELLTGHTPFEAHDLMAAGFEAMVRTIREKEPPRPSTRLSTLMQADLTTVAKCRRAAAPKLIRQVEGDLDWIVMKALDKDRTRRYETAASFASDVHNFLTNDPVMARPPSAVYRLRKLVRRNKLAFAAASSITLALIAALTVSVWALGRERQARQRSDRTVNLLQDLLAGVEPANARGRDTTLIRIILDKTVERMSNDLKDYPEIQAEILATIGQVYYSVGENAAAEQMQRKALSLLEKAGGHREQFARSLDALGLLMRDQSHFSNAVQLLSQALEIRAQTVGKNHLEYANSLNSLGVALRSVGDLIGSEQCHRDAFRIQTNIFRRTKDGSMAVSLNNLGLSLRDKGALAEAEKCFRDSLEIQNLVIDHPETAPTIGQTTANLAFVLRDQGRFSEAESEATNALARYRRSLPPDHPAIATALHDLALVLSSEKRIPEAVELHRQALDIRRQKLGTNNASTATSLDDLALVIRRTEPAEAEDMARQALAIRTELYGETHLAVATSYNNLGLVLQARGKLDEAWENLRKALGLEVRLLGDEHYAVATTHNNLALVLSDRNEFTNALAEIDRAISIRQKVLNKDHPALRAAFDDKKGIETKWNRARNQDKPAPPQTPGKPEAKLTSGDQMVGGWMGSHCGPRCDHRVKDARAALLPVADQFPDEWRIPYQIACYECQSQRHRAARNSGIPIALACSVSIAQRKSPLRSSLISEMNFSGGPLAEPSRVRLALECA